MKLWRSITTTVSALLIIAAALSSCGASNSSNFNIAADGNFASTETARATSTYNESADTAAFDGIGMDDEIYEEEYGTDDSGGARDAKNDLSERKIIRNASVNFETRNFDTFMTELSGCIERFGGYVQNEERYGESYSYKSSRSAYLTARIPVDQYDGFMSDVCEIGNLTYKSEGTNDVTMTYVDIESHVRALETEYNTLLEILEKAENVEDVISIQSRISEVTYQIESYKSQLRKYDDLISYCTVNINISEVERETQNVREMTFGEKIINGLSETFATIGKDASDFAVWFVVSLPYIVIWAAIIAIAVVLIRVIIRKNRIRRMEKIMRQQNGGIDQTETGKTDKKDH